MILEDDSMIRLNAAWASGVTVSASSNIMILKGGFGYVSSTCISVSLSLLLSSLLSFSFPFAKKFFLGGAADPTERLAKCLILSLTIDIPRSSDALSSRTLRDNCDGCHSVLHSASATLVFPVPGGP